MPPAPRIVEVVETAWRTPRMVSVVFGGAGLDGFEVGAFTDHYVKLKFPPRTRTYTVRDWDAEAQRLTVDFVVHGDDGVAGPWAAAARPGDTLELAGPGGAYAPDPAAAWHLLVGDASVLPAIAVSLARVGPGVPVHVVVELEDEGEQQELTSPGDLAVTWVPAEHGGAPLLAAVAALELPDAAGQAFVHGEASSVRAVRQHLLVERGLPREAVSATGYWKRTRTEEGWREDKAEWLRQAESDVA